MLDTGYFDIFFNIENQITRVVSRYENQQLFHQALKKHYLNP